MIHEDLEPYAELLADLRLLNIKRVEVTFSGSGDNGQIDDAVAFLENGDDISLDLPLPGHEDETVSAVTATLLNYEVKKRSDLISNMADALIEKHVQLDWYNNEGGDGTLNIYPFAAGGEDDPMIEISTRQYDRVEVASESYYL